MVNNSRFQIDFNKNDNVFYVIYIDALIIILNKIKLNIMYIFIYLYLIKSNSTNS
jgi:hypothetical protein